MNNQLACGQAGDTKGLEKEEAVVTTKPDLTVNSYKGVIYLRRHNDSMFFNGLEELARVFLAAQDLLEKDRTTQVKYLEQQLKALK